MVVLKIQHGSDIRRITLDNSISCEELHDFVGTLFGLSNFSIKYTDEENDEICVTSQSEWEEALFMFRDKPIVRLVVFEKEEEKKNSGEPIPQPPTTESPERKEEETPLPPQRVAPTASDGSTLMEKKPKRHKHQRNLKNKNKDSKRVGRAKKHQHNKPGKAKQNKKHKKGKNKKKKLTPPPPPPRDDRPRLFPNVSGMLESLSTLGTEGSTKIEEVFGSIFGSSKGGMQKIEHPAICDHCFGRVVTVRYKCGNCANFELCEACEALERRKVHDPTHVFLKIRDPITFEAPGALLPFNLYEYTWWPQDEDEDQRQSHHHRICKKGGRSDPGAPPLQSRFVKDVTMDDGTVLSPNEKFTKIWRMQNNGPTAWPEHTKLCCVSGDRMGAPDEVEFLDRVVPDEYVNLSMPMRAPPREGRYISTWRLRAPSTGKGFGHRVWADIVVRKAPWDIEHQLEENAVAFAQEQVPAMRNTEEEIPLLSSPCPVVHNDCEENAEEPPPPARLLGEDDGLIQQDEPTDRIPDERSPQHSSEDDSWVRVQMEKYNTFASGSSSSDEESAKEFIPLVYLGHNDYPQEEEEEEEEEEEPEEEEEEEGQQEESVHEEAAEATEENTAAEAAETPANKEEETDAQESAPTNRPLEKKEEELKLPLDPFDEMLEQLAVMGFTDVEKNKTILTKRKGDLVAAIHDLLG